MLPSTMATSNNIPRGYLLKSVGSTYSLHSNNDNPQSRLDAVQTRGVSPWSRGATRLGALLPAGEDGHSDVDLGPTSWSNRLHPAHTHPVVDHRVYRVSSPLCPLSRREGPPSTVCRQCQTGTMA